MYLAGAQVGRIFTEAEIKTKGKGHAAGSRVVDKDGKEYVFCQVAASQNLINGHVVTINAGFVVTVAAVATGNTRGDQLGVAVITTLTASASMYIWVQTYGRGNVLASTSILPNIGLKIGTTAGVLTTAGAVTASAHTPGIILTATSNVVPALTACILQYPRYGSSSNF